MQTLSTAIFLLVLRSSTVQCDLDYPCYTNWIYSKLSGKCYLPFTDTLNYSDALTKCKDQLKQFPEAAAAVSLSKVESIPDADGMRNVLIDQGNNALMWMDAKRDGSVFRWSNGMSVNMALLASLSSSADLGGPCLKISYVYSMGVSGSTLTYSITSGECNGTATYLCQHNAVSCLVDNLPMFNGEVEVLDPPNINVANRPFVSCRVGNYRVSELKTPLTANSNPIPMNHANCTGKSNPGDANPFKYQAFWVLNETQKTIEICTQVACEPFNGTLTNVQSQIVIQDSQKKSSYPFGYTFPVTCMKGFVNLADRMSNVAAMTCSQSISQKQMGVWSPENNVPCTAMLCNKTALLAMIPFNGVLYAARNRANLREYNVDLQKSSLPYYDNIITVRCNDGFFFLDRRSEKSIICALSNNSLVIGEWQGYVGTTLPLDPFCRSATCTYEAIVIKPNMNLQTSFYMMDTNGVYQNQTQPSLDPYPYQTKMRFFCLEGFSSVNQANDQNLTCGPQGVWIPNLTPCVQVTAQLQLGNKLHFLPPAVESASAKQVGYVAIVILVLVLSLIAILDVSTISRDARTMRTNIKNLKRFVNRNKT